MIDNLLGTRAERRNDLDRFPGWEKWKLNLHTEAVEAGDVVVLPNPESLSPGTAGFPNRRSQSARNERILFLGGGEQEAVKILDVVRPLEDHEITDAPPGQHGLFAGGISDKFENLVERLVPFDQVLPQ